MEDNRIKRILCWGLFSIMACFIALFYHGCIKEKQPIKVYAPKDMSVAFDCAMYNSELGWEYKIEMVEDEGLADICVKCSHEDNNDDIKIAYSPIVVGYSQNKYNFDKLKEKNILIPSEYNSDNFEIVFLKIVNEVINEGKWLNLGIEELNQVKVFYPSEDTPYWDYFYDFMLVTVNNGNYPNTDAELKSSKEIVKRFIESKYTEQFDNIEEQLNRTGGFTDNALWILPEKDLINLNLECRVLYPTNTVYVNFYAEADEIGSKLVGDFDKQSILVGNFYYGLNRNGYRTEKDSKFNFNNGNYNKIYDLRNEYSIAKIPENKIEETSQSDNH